MERVKAIDARTGRTITIPAAWLPGHKPESPAPKAETPNIVGGKAPDPGHSPGLPSGQRPEPAKRKTKPKAKA